MHQKLEPFVFEEAFFVSEEQCLDSCPPNCNEFMYLGSLDTSKLDIESECQGNARLQHLTFTNIDSPGAAFFWKFLRTSKWLRKYEQAEEGNFATVNRDDKFDRCMEKLEKDVAFVNVMMAPKNMAKAVLDMRYISSTSSP